MSRNFHEQFEQEAPPLPSDRSTGFVFAAAAGLIAYGWRADPDVLRIALGAAGAFLLLSLVWPIALRPLNIVWMKFAHLLNRIVNPVVMLVLFAIAIVPAGLIMQVRHDPLRRRRKPAGESYWIDRKDAPASMINQF